MLQVQHRATSDGMAADCHELGFPMHDACPHCGGGLSRYLTWDGTGWDLDPNTGWVHTRTGHTECGPRETA